MFSDSAIISGGKTTTDQAANTCENCSPKTFLKVKFWVEHFCSWCQIHKILGGKREGRSWKRRGKLPEPSSWPMKFRGGGRGGQRQVIRGQEVGRVEQEVEVEEVEVQLGG